MPPIDAQPIHDDSQCEVERICRECISPLLEILTVHKAVVNHNSFSNRPTPQAYENIRRKARGAVRFGVVAVACDTVTQRHHLVNIMFLSKDNVFRSISPSSSTSRPNTVITAQVAVENIRNVLCSTRWADQCLPLIAYDDFYCKDHAMVSVTPLSDTILRALSGTSDSESSGIGGHDPLVSIDLVLCFQNKSLAQPTAVNFTKVMPRCLETLRELHNFGVLHGAINERNIFIHNEENGRGLHIVLGPIDVLFAATALLTCCTEGRSSAPVKVRFQEGQQSNVFMDRTIRQMTRTSALWKSLANEEEHLLMKLFESIKKKVNSQRDTTQRSIRENSIVNRKVPSERMAPCAEKRVVSPPIPSSSQNDSEPVAAQPQVTSFLEKESTPHEQSRLKVHTRLNANTKAPINMPTPRNPQTNHPTESNRTLQRPIVLGRCTAKRSVNGGLIWENDFTQLSSHRGKRTKSLWKRCQSMFRGLFQ